MRILTWNLFHGRSIPGAGRELRREFESALAGWSWDVALLQEVPPWWPEALGRACDAQAFSVLTSRNTLLPLRRAIAQRFPDLIKSNGGGANAILVRGFRVDEHRVEVLRHLPERRVVHAVRLGGGWVGNVHAQGDRRGRHHEPSAQGDMRAAGAALAHWSADPGAPLVLGGDANTSAPVVPGLTLLGHHGVDVLLARGMVLDGGVEVLEHAPLSDHAPVVGRLVRG